MNASSFAANSSLSLNVNFLANNYYVLSSLTTVDEKFGLAGILYMAVIVLYKLVRQMISCRCFSPGSLARSASTSEFVPELPDDIMMEILVRLPVSSIFLFRSVSRSFRSLVLESHTCNRLPPVLVGILCVSALEQRASYVSLRKGFGDNYDPTRFLIESSLCRGTMDSKFGLIICRKSLTSISQVIYLCNPTTRKCRSISYSGTSYYNFILAFDPSWSKHHYEVIKISGNWEDGGYDFEVFSSKTGRWDRKFTIADRYIDLEVHNSCLANGLLYMFARCFSGLLAINCADGSYKRVALPSPNRCEEVGKLCNSCGSLMYSKYCRGELWVWTLLKNENESCWLLRHQINLKDKLKKIGFPFPLDTQPDRCYGCILLFQMDTMVLLINQKTFFYNLESNRLQVDTSAFTAYGHRLLPWSPCYYAVAGL